MRISDWSSDVCSSDLSLEFVDGVLAWRLVSLDCLHACEADACDQANAVVNSPASAPLVALLSLRVAVVLDESKMRRGACRAVMPSVVAASRQRAIGQWFPAADARLASIAEPDELVDRDLRLLLPVGSRHQPFTTDRKRVV